MPSLFPSIFFSVDIQHAHDISDTLRRHGVKVYPISGKTPDEEERMFLRMFKAGEIDGLASCGVLQEGFDAPNAMGGFLCRPTKSGLLYRQMVGRVLRPFPAPTGNRYYQSECLAAMGLDLQDGINAQLVVLPTGTGKTFIAAHTPELVKRWKRGKIRGRTLFLVHRDNLVTQAADTFREWTDYSVGIEKGGGHYAGDADVVVASLQCLSGGKAEENDGEITWEYSKRIKTFNPSQFDTVIIDEAHHAVSQGGSYQNVMRYFRVLKKETNRDPDVLLLLITATPDRADNLGMEAVCDKITYSYQLDQAIEDGFLAPIMADRCETEVDISKVRTSRGDLNIPDLANAVNTPERNEIIAQKYLEIRDRIQPDIVGGKKPYACVVDFVDVAGKHRLVTIPKLFGLRENFDAKGGNIKEQADEIEKLQEENPTLDLQSAPNMEAVKASLKRLDLLAVPGLPAALRGLTRLVWMQETPGSYRLGMMDSSMLTIRESSLGAWEVYRHVRGVRTKMLDAKTIGQAFKQADDLVPEKERKVMVADASWRKEPPTEKQAAKLVKADRHWNNTFKGSVAQMYAHAVGRFEAGDESFSRGGVSQRIDAAGMAKR